MKPLLLDLFCGAGGCSRGYADAGFEVVGVDINPQPNYPFEFKQSDALEFMECIQEAVWSFGSRGYDAIHASPPCQAYSALGWHPQNRDIEYPDLVEPTRQALARYGAPYVIENVVGAPLRDPVALCGSSFGLPLLRHRLFETNFSVMVPPCAHGRLEARFDIFSEGKWRKSITPAVYGTGGGKAAEHWPEALGIDWMTRSEMALAIPPAYTEHIGGYLMRHLSFAEKAAA